MNSVIWKLDKTIDEIYDLLEKTRCIESDHNNPSVNLTYEWKNKNKQKISNYDCVTAMACLDKFTGFKVNTSYSHALFLEYNNSTYCNIIGVKGVEARIRTKLMEKGKYSPWGKLMFKNIDGYTFEKDFFYWLLSKKGEKIGSNNITILDISEFQCNTDRNADNYSGVSRYGNIDNKPPLQALISAYEDISSLQMHIKKNNNQYVFRLDNDGRVDIKLESCGEFATQNPQQLSIFEAVIHIYYTIIPLLRQQYNKDMQNRWKV
ncbi:hypothetical protein [Vallitalea guaymasensis]|uniref:Uncharacterized protein n=1 Tax=Vallitalea guaymasensis TaxID=1185412 RepID=A0A8J8MAX2_9FIRM|nr:hypothetical protein [Vallitalea guaymasensis]QUH29609.1 hypothetical protein HYG85_12115 [Vallitalea guaymasensis]